MKGCEDNRVACIPLDDGDLHVHWTKVYGGKLTLGDIGALRKGTREFVITAEDLPGLIIALSQIQKEVEKRKG